MKQQIKKYNEYKKSSVSLLDEIPEHWTLGRVKDLVKIKGGQDQKKVLNHNGKYPVYGSGGIFGRADKYLYRKVSVLLGRKGTIDKPLYVDIPFWTVDTMYYTEILNNTNPRFFYYRCTCIPFDLYQYGSAIPSMTQGDLININFAIPPLKEQAQIANYLDAKTRAIDKKVKLLQQKIKHYKAYRKTLINQTVTKGLDKTVKLKDSGINWIGEIPEYWEVKRYKSFGKTIKGKNMEMSDLEFDNSLPLLSLEYLRNDSVQHPTFCYSKDKLLKSTAEDLIIVWDGAAVGEILKSKEGYVSSTIAKLDINKKKFNTRYFYHLRGAIDYKLKQIPTGMGIPHLNPTLFKNFKCPSPPIKEQQQIADYLDAKTTTIDKIVKNIENQIITLKELRKTLINEVVTGKVKVSA